MQLQHGLRCAHDGPRHEIRRIAIGTISPLGPRENEPGKRRRTGGDLWSSPPVAMHHLEPLDAYPDTSKMPDNIRTPCTLQRDQALQHDDGIDQLDAVPDELIGELERRVCDDA